MWDPPPYLSACSQAAWVRDAAAGGEAPMLVRNYDFAPDRFDGVVWSTAWNGRRVLGTSHSGWGLLDGTNNAGLTISLAFGGRRVVGRQVGIPLVLRYVLETCATVQEQVRGATERVAGPNLAYNLTLLDESGSYLTALVEPDEEPRLADIACTTNHQDVIEWPEHAEATQTIERQGAMMRALDAAATAASFVEAFLEPPLYSGSARAIATLYTAVYRVGVGTGSVRYLWPGSTWERSFDSRHGTHEALIPVTRSAGRQNDDGPITDVGILPTVTKVPAFASLAPPERRRSRLDQARFCIHSGPRYVLEAWAKLAPQQRSRGRDSLSRRRSPRSPRAERPEGRASFARISRRTARRHALPVPARRPAERVFR